MRRLIHATIVISLCALLGVTLFWTMWEPATNRPPSPTEDEIQAAGPGYPKGQLQLNSHDGPVELSLDAPSISEWPPADPPGSTTTPDAAVGESLASDSGELRLLPPVDPPTTEPTESSQLELPQLHRLPPIEPATSSADEQLASSDDLIPSLIPSVDDQVLSSTELETPTVTREVDHGPVVSDDVQQTEPAPLDESPVDPLSPIDSVEPTSLGDASLSPPDPPWLGEVADESPTEPVDGDDSAGDEGQFVPVGQAADGWPDELIEEYQKSLQQEPQGGWQTADDSTNWSPPDMPVVDEDLDRQQSELERTDTRPDDDEPRLTAPHPEIAEGGRTTRHMTTRAMAVVNERVLHTIRHAFSLASRGAVYSARAEFVAALRTIAEATDAEEGGKWHSRKLDAGLLALREADDFMSQRPDVGIEVPQILEAHKTPVLKDELDRDTSPLIARQRYLMFAQTQLAQACGNNSAASRALYALGKLYSGRAIQTGDPLLTSGPKAVVFHRAAMLVDPTNHLAANELGVLLARYGELQQARDMLIHSLTVRQMSEAWYNLSVVHQRLGQQDLSQRARYEGELLQGQGQSWATAHGEDAPIQWVGAEEFTRASPGPTPMGAGDAPGRGAAAPLPRPQPTDPASFKGAGKSWWLPWK